MNILKRSIINFLFCSLCFSQSEETIYMTVTDTIIDFFSRPSAFQVSSDWDSSEMLVPYARVSDISNDNQNLLFYFAGGPWYYQTPVIMLYNFETIDTLEIDTSGIVESSFRFSYDNDIIVFRRDSSIYKYSITENSETFIANGSSFVLSPNKQELLILQQSFWNDSLDIKIADIQSGELTMLNRVLNVDNNVFYWRNDDFLYFSMQDSNNILQLFKLDASELNQDPIQLTNSNNDWYFLNSRNSRMDKIIFRKEISDNSNDYWIYDFLTNESTFLNNIEISPTIDFQAWSPDKSKVAISSLEGYCIMWFCYGRLYIIEINDGTYSSPQGNFAGGPLFWIGFPSFDINDDGTVDNSDFIMLLDYLINGQESIETSDINLDSSVDVFDLLILSDYLQEL